MRKLLEDLTPHRPFGFETSFSVELADHTAMKSEALLEAKAAAAIADSAAFIFIDAIDPIGTLNPKVYDRMGRIFDRLMPYYGELGGKRVADVAVYYSLDSKFDFAGNGRPVAGADTTDAHTKSVTAVTRALGSHHLPFAVVTKATLAHLNDHKVLILPNVNMMDDDEADRDPRVGARGRHAAGHRLDVAGRYPRPAAQGLRPGRRASASRSSRRAGRPGRTTSRRRRRRSRLRRLQRDLSGLRPHDRPGDRDPARARRPRCWRRRRWSGRPPTRPGSRRSTATRPGSRRAGPRSS